jgi:hypothetical protein
MAGQILLDVRLQKNGTLVLRAPDDSVYAFTLDPKKANDGTLASIGKTVLEIVLDPDQPEAVIVPPRGVHQPHPGGDARGYGGAAGGGVDLETHVRAGLDSMFPGASRALDFLQALSGNAEDGDD